MAKKAKVGRPAMFTEGKTQIGIRMGIDDRSLLERASELDRRGLSDWCRLALIDAAKARIQAEEKKG